jgi:hypothetical protein
MSDMEVVLLCLAVGAVSAFVGWRVSANFHEKLFSEMLDRLGVSDQELVTLARDMATEAGVEDTELEEYTEEIAITIEQAAGQLYAYRKETGEFIGQGTDKDALLARLIQQFPQGARLILTDEDGAEFIKE